MSKVKAPSGLTLTRNGNTFKATWKKGDSYSTMQYSWGWEVDNGNTVSVNLDERHTTSSTHTTKSFNRVNVVMFGVRGKKNGKWSDWSEKTYRVYAPKKPNIDAEFVQTAMTTFSWSPVTDNHDRPITGAKVQSVLVQDCPSGVDALASLKEWKNATIQSKTASGNITPVNGAGEDTGLISGKSYTRVVRVKEYGLGGESDWRYSKHVYAAPYAAVNIRGTVKNTEASLNCEAYWETPTDAGHPIDENGVVLQYAIETPDAGMACPENPSWTQLPPQGSTSGTEGKFFTIGSPITADKCLFLSVITKHDLEEVESIGVLAGGESIGPLSAPVFTEQPSITSTTITVKASNESNVSDSFVVDYLEKEDGSIEILGKHDSATKVYQVSGIENARIGLKAFVGTWNATLKQVEDIKMESPMTWSIGNVPVAPTLLDFELEQSTVQNTVNVTWKYSWADADACEISWSTEPDAWISTDDPEYYIVLKGLENKLAIKDVEAGEPLYVRIRYVKGFDEEAILSPYSDTKAIVISTVPAVPTLTLEKAFYTKGEDITCSWIYVTADGTEQAQAIVAEHTRTTSGGVTTDNYLNPVEVSTQQKLIYPNTWAVGTQHKLCVKVANGSGNWSDWSEDVTVTIAEPLSCEITQASLTTVSTGYELQSLPLTVTVTGAGTGGQTVLAIVRTEDYRLERPTGEDYKGHNGEVIYQNVYTGEAQQTIVLNDIQGHHLDDGASYKIYASIEDDYGQTDNDEIPFIVNWNHKAVMPSATVAMSDIATITIASNSSAQTGDYVDIYRKSVDGTELIYTGAQFGGKYVDPYPTIGDYGYLIVGRNAYGDYIMSNTQPAWYDLDATYESDKTIIDFNGERVELFYNVDVSHSWNKDFKKTKYLGGSIIGDYVTGVERTGNVNFVSIPILEESMLESMRRLAEYEGECHIRTKEGSSFTACIQVSEDDSHDKHGFVRSFSMSIEKVDPVVLDGMTEADWEAQ